MSAFTNYFEAWICNWIRGTAAPTAPGTVYVALFNGSPTDTGTGGSDVTTTIRPAGRVAATFGAPTDGTITNSALVDFGAANASATISHFCVFDAASGGNPLFYGALTGGSQAISAATAVSFAVGQLSFNVA